MQSEIAALKQQQNAASKNLDEQRALLDEQMQRAERKVTEVANALDELNRAARMTDADFGVQLERLIKELQELRGSLELSEYRISKLETKVEGEGSLTARIEALEKQLTTGSPPPAVSSADAPPKDKKELLAYAQKLIKEGKVNDGRGVLRDVVNKWPNETGITDAAFYTLGETYYAEKKYRSALQEYIKVVEKFGTGVYADDAYYKIGLASMDIGNLEDAKIFFSEIVHNHKKSPLLKSASKKLEEIDKRLAKEKKKKK